MWNHVIIITTARRSSQRLQVGSSLGVLDAHRQDVKQTACQQGVPHGSKTTGSMSQHPCPDWNSLVQAEKSCWSFCTVVAVSGPVRWPAHSSSAHLVYSRELTMRKRTLATQMRPGQACHADMIAWHQAASLGKSLPCLKVSNACHAGARPQRGGVLSGQRDL